MTEGATNEWMFIGLSLVLVAANAFFVATEMALVKVRPSRLKTLVEQGVPGAARVLHLTRRLEGVLSATQFGVTLTSLALGWIGEPAFAHLIERLIFPYVQAHPLALRVGHTVAIVVGFGFITALHIVLGELAPKSLAIQRAEQTALATVLPMRIFYGLFFPGIWLLGRMSRYVLKLLGLSSSIESEAPHNEQELRAILDSSLEAGMIDTARAELLGSALQMAEKTARQVMVPRNQVTFLDLEEPLVKNIADARGSGHTWLPVCRGNLDQVEGVVNVKDLFFLLAGSQLKSLTQVQRPVLFVPENVTLEQLLAEFRRRRRQMAVVVDEHGGTSGIITLADVVSEIIGDVAEIGRNVDEVKMLPGGRLELPGTTQLEDLEDRLEVKFELDGTDVATIGGYLMAKLERVPAAGDTVSVDEYEIKVEEMDGPRVLKVRIAPVSPVPPQVPKAES